MHCKAEGWNLERKRRCISSQGFKSRCATGEEQARVVSFMGFIQKHSDGVKEPVYNGWHTCLL